MLLHDHFDRITARHPDRIALDIPPGRDRPARHRLTYGDLSARSHAIQSAVARVAARDTIIGILLPRTAPDAYAAQLGIMRAGAAYTAIDPAFPAGRVAEIVGDARAPLVVTDTVGAARLTAAGVSDDRILCVERLPAADAEGSRASDRPRDDARLAYVIYTSGTTGRPKGVLIEHRAIANLIQSDVDEFGLTPADRVAHGSSHAYDSSLEEVWLAWSAGASVVVMDDDTVRSGPDLVGWLGREAISVFCPPPTLLRATGVRSPAGLLPGLRLLYVGGEALTAEVVDVWAPGRRMVNGYGPTECAVVATRGDVRAGAPITIGRPIAHNTCAILNEALQPVADGDTGELCIGGAGLGRGYHDDPELTARKFIAHPTLGRLYRTGDLARRLPVGDLVCLGRADAQVKIRGYRIELEEIESRLASLPDVRHAAARVQDAGNRAQLVAFVVPAPGAGPVDTAQLRARLARELPPHMVPVAIGVIDALPTSTGGKLDRARLPALRAAAGPFVARDLSPLESTIESGVRAVLSTGSDLSPDADFFQDMGGDSLFAAELVTSLRARAEMTSLTVRDVYAAPTIARLAAHIEAMPPAASDVDADPYPAGGVDAGRETASGQPIVAGAIQTAWLAIELILGSALAYLVLFVIAPALLTGATPFTAALWLPALWIAGAVVYLPLSVVAVVLVKRLVVGRYRASRSPVWGWLYLRHWIVRQSLRFVPWRWLEGTVFQMIALRALGARIGERVHIHRGVDLQQGGWDLLEIGDAATIGQEAVIRLVDLEDEQVVVGPVVIGAGATLETRSSIAGGATIEARGYLTALSSLPAGARIPAGERWSGVPAARVDQAPEAPPIPAGDRVLSPPVHGLLMVGGRIAASIAAPFGAAIAFATLASATGLGLADIGAWLRSPSQDAWVVWMLAGAAAAAIPLAVIGQLLALRLLGRVRPGVVSRWSPAYLRIWAKTDLVRRAGDWLSGSLLWPIWLRAAGMRIGANSEISTIIDVVPELISIGPDTFFADGVYLGSPHVHRGTVTLRTTTLGSGVFLGNHVVVPGGARVADGVLVGVSTVAGPETAQPGSAWFGHPPFALSRPPAPAIDRRLTHDPSLVRRLNRWTWELGRFVIPVATSMVLLMFGSLLLRAADAHPAARVALVWLPVLVIGAAATLAALVLGLKWALLGRVRPGQHALWSCWCSRWDFLYVAWGRLARPFLARFDGTLWLAWYLRAMGMRIGRRVVLGPGFAQVVDPDMIRIDDDATVHALFQAHTFEDRLLKIERVRIRRRSTVGCGAVLFYGVDVGEGAQVEAQSVIMKNERLAPHRRYEGAPAAIRTTRLRAPDRPDRSAPPPDPSAVPASS